MKVAVINEVSARDKNTYIIEALKKQPVEIFNVGMKEGENDTQLNYIHTGFMAAILLNLGAVDMVIGGCGTGQGFLISAMQYPNVFCGLITEALDAWLFGQINAGNCISLALNKGFGWAGDINLEYIFEKLFSDEFGKGYPAQRQLSQQQSRTKLYSISQKAHKPFAEIFKETDREIVSTVLEHKSFINLVSTEAKDKELQRLILSES